MSARKSGKWFAALAGVLAAGVGLGATQPAGAATRASAQPPVVTQTILVGSGPNGVAISPMTGRIYIADGNDDTIPASTARQNRHQHHRCRQRSGRGRGQPADRQNLRHKQLGRNGLGDQRPDRHRHQHDHGRRSAGGGRGQPGDRQDLRRRRQRQHGLGNQRPDRHRHQHHRCRHLSGCGRGQRGDRQDLRRRRQRQHGLGNQRPDRYRHRHHPGRPRQGHPDAVAVSPRTGKIYVINYYGGTASMINGRTDTVTSTIPVGLQPDAVAVSPRTGKIYVTNTNISDGSAGTVSVIERPDRHRHRHHPGRPGTGRGRGQPADRQDLRHQLPGRHGLGDRLVPLEQPWAPAATVTLSCALLRETAFPVPPGTVG